MAAIDRTLTQEMGIKKSPSFDYLFKLLLIGDSGIGKTSLLLRFAEDTFNASFVPTIGVDFKFRTIELDGKKIKLQVWDTAGQERFQTITTAYYRGAMGILLVYDVTDNKTFVNIKKWTRNVERHAVENVNQILIGNKRDIVAKRVVTTEQGEALAKELGMQFVETSAKNGDNVEEAFLSLVRTIKERLTNDPIGKEEDCLDLKEEEREQGEHSCC